MCLQGNCQAGPKGEKGERGLAGMPAQPGESLFQIKSTDYSFRHADCAVRNVEWSKKWVLKSECEGLISVLTLLAFKQRTF